MLRAKGRSLSQRALVAAKLWHILLLDLNRPVFRGGHLV
jgi:hypothetical protein